MRYADNCCKCTEIYSPEHKYVFTGPCIYCKQPVSISVAAPELFIYRRGASIQQALSNNADEREFLMSGICSACWSKTFSEDEDDSDEPVCDGCGEPTHSCTCHESDMFDGDF